jgi:NACalpha-BTF3-like transcription factor
MPQPSPRLPYQQQPYYPPQPQQNYPTSTPPSNRPYSSNNNGNLSRTNSRVTSRNPSPAASHLDMYGNPVIDNDNGGGKPHHSLFRKPSFLQNIGHHNQQQQAPQPMQTYYIPENNSHSHDQRSMNSYSQYDDQRSVNSSSTNQRYSGNQQQQYQQYQQGPAPQHRRVSSNSHLLMPDGTPRPYHEAGTQEELDMRRRLGYREEDVRVLTDMGFAKDQAVQALVENNQNVGRAAEMLLRS